MSAKLEAADVADLSMPAGRLVDRVRERYDWGRRGRRSSLVEDLLSWCYERLPVDDSAAVLCWGDARLGNLMHRGVEPVAVLDWDATSISARERDVGWFIFFHSMSQDLAEGVGARGLPDLFTRASFVRQYERVSGVPVENLEFWEGLAALKIAASCFRGQHLAVYGMDEKAPLDSLIPHARIIRSMLTGEYWTTDRRASP